jgi:hypothetical protein
LDRVVVLIVPDDVRAWRILRRRCYHFLVLDSEALFRGSLLVSCREVSLSVLWWCSRSFALFFVFGFVDGPEEQEENSDKTEGSDEHGQQLSGISDSGAGGTDDGVHFVPNECHLNHGRSEDHPEEIADAEKVVNKI